MAGDKEIEKKVVEYLLGTPKALAVLLASFLSGHLWIFMIKAFRKRKVAIGLVESKTGRVAIGLCWMATILIPVYAIRYRDVYIEYDKILEVSILTIVVALFVQLVIFVVFLVYGDKA